MLISTALAGAEIVSYGQNGYDYATTNLSYTAYFKINSNWGDGIRFCVNTSNGDKCLVYQPSDMSYRDVYGSQDYLGSIGGVGVVVSGDTAYYPGVYSNVSLTYSFYRQKMKETYFLSSKPRSPATYLGSNITLDFGGYIKYDSGVSIFVDGVNVTGTDFKTKKEVLFKYDNQTLFKLNKPTMMDSFDNDTQGFHEVNGEYEVKNQGGTIWFYLRTPYEFLNDSNTVFPVRVDPTTSTWNDGNLTALYDFAEGSGSTISDSMDTHDGTLSGTTSYVSGLYVGDYGVNFPKNGYYNLANYGDFGGGGEFEIDFVFKGGVGTGTVFSLDNNDFRLYYDGGNQRWQAYVAATGGNCQYYSNTNEEPVDTLINVTMVYNGSNVLIFDNGVQTGVLFQQGCSGTIPAITSYARVGKDDSQALNGTLYCLGVYSNATLDSLARSDFFDSCYGGGGSPPSALVVDCSTNPVTSVDTVYNSSYFINGTGHWDVEANVTWEQPLVLPNTCQINLLKSNKLVIKR